MTPQTQNAVIMGRKTWESIPPRFRPLKDRQNIIITRSSDDSGFESGIKASSFESAIEILEEKGGKANKAFVIGGAQIYKAALERKEAKRILLTRVLSDFECDTVFPVVLQESGKAEGWERKTKKELDEWVGENVAEGKEEEGGTRYVFEMWERVE